MRLGALLERVVRSRDAAHATGQKSSAAQAAQAASRDHARLEVRLEDWADHATVAPCDAITSIGAFEPFAAAGLTRTVRVDAYRRFFTKCAAMPASSGRLKVQTIASPDAFDREAHDVADYGAFVRECIFPDPGPHG